MILIVLAACDGKRSAGVRSADSARAAARGRNVVLVTMDTTRADRIGCYGHAAARTPFVDRMAAEGILAERALAAAPVTLPSHASILSGRNPIRHGVRDNGIFRMKPEEVLLAEVLKANGYATAAFISAYPLDRSYGLDQGFDHYDDALKTSASAGAAQVERRAGETVDSFLRWMDRAPMEPWFVWLHFFDPHAPLDPPAPFAEQQRDAYDAEIAYLDSQLERLFAAYDGEGRLDRTFLVITAFFF